MQSIEWLDEEWLWDPPLSIEQAIIFKMARELETRPKFDDYSIGDEVSLSCTWICPKCGYEHKDSKMLVSTWSCDPLLQCIRPVGKELLPDGFGGTMTVDKICGGLGPKIYLRKTAHALANEAEAKKKEEETK